MSGAIDEILIQTGSTADMVLDVAGLIAYAANIFTLEPGDVILTGSPPGRANLAPGQSVTVSVKGIGEMTNPVQLAWSTTSDWSTPQPDVGGLSLSLWSSALFGGVLLVLFVVSCRKGARPPVVSVKERTGANQKLAPVLLG